MASKTLTSKQKGNRTRFLKKKTVFEAEHATKTFPYTDMRDFSYFYDLSCDEIDFITEYMQNIKKLIKKKELLIKENVLEPISKDSEIIEPPISISVYEKITDILESPISSEPLSLEVIEKLGEARELLQPPERKIEIPKVSAEEIYQTKKPNEWQLLKFQWESKEKWCMHLVDVLFVKPFTNKAHPIVNEVHNPRKVLIDLYNMIDISGFSPNEKQFEAIKPKSPLKNPTRKRVRSPKHEKVMDRAGLRDSDSDSDSDIEASIRKQSTFDAKPAESDEDDEYDEESMCKQIKLYLGDRIGDARLEGTARKDIISVLIRSCKATRRFPEIQNFAKCHPNRLKHVLQNLYAASIRADKSYTS